jgi:nucleoside-diphosphate-sugar epimerase
MRILITGSAGHLGEALMRTLEDSPHEAIGVDLKAGPFTQRVGSILDRGFVKQSAIRCLRALEDFRSPLALAVGSKGYHATTFSQGPYPTTRD